MATKITGTAVEGQPIPQASADIKTAMATAVKGLNPDVNQIYPIVNAAYNESTGIDNITAIDTNSLIAMGNSLDQLGKKDTWLNSLSKRIGLTIDDFRVYETKYAPLAKTNLEWGAYVQKFHVDVPDAVEEKSVDVGRMDGLSVDQWTITNPTASEKIFGLTTPYVLKITIQDRWLNEAFLGSAAMAALIRAIFGKMRNKKEIGIENLSRLAIGNFVINLKPNQHFHLVTLYNTINGKAVTATEARTNPDVLRWCVGFINNISKKMESMSVLYNSSGYEKFTPKSKQHFYVLSDFMTIYDTVVMYDAHNPKYITTNPDVEVPFWQGSGKQTGDDWEAITRVYGTNVAGEQVQLNNLVGIIFDDDAIGTFRQQERIRTTPVNAYGEYYNTFWHENPMFFNDMDENGIAFFLD